VRLVPRPSKEDAEKVLRQFIADTQRLREVLLILRRPPAGIDEVLLGQAMVAGMGRASWHTVRASHALPAGAIRAALDALAEAKHTPAFFLRGAVDVTASDETMRQEWSAALGALLDMQTTYAWGSKQRKAKIAALANNPRFLSAIQTAAVGSRAVGLDALAVLAHDGSDASMDALVLQVERATQSPSSWLEILERLKTHASDTPAMKAMFEQIERRVDAQRAESPAIVLAQAIGLGPLKELWFDVWVGSQQLNVHRVPRYQLSCSVRSTAERWFHLSVSELPDDYREGTLRRTSSFSSEKTIRDDLELGVPVPAQLPQWLADTAKKLKLEWNWSERGPRTVLRGKKRERLSEWLRGG